MTFLQNGCKGTLCVLSDGHLGSFLSSRLLPGTRFEFPSIYRLFWRISQWYSAVSHGKHQDVTFEQTTRALFSTSLRTHHLWRRFHFTVRSVSSAFESVLLHNVGVCQIHSFLAPGWRNRSFASLMRGSLCLRSQPRQNLKAIFRNVWGLEIILR